jgi:hypothetical protein
LTAASHLKTASTAEVTLLTYPCHTLFTPLLHLCTNATDCHDSNQACASDIEFMFGTLGAPFGPPRGNYGPQDSFDSRRPEESYDSRYDGPRESYDSRKPEASYDSRYDGPRDSYDSRRPEASYDSRYDGPRESYDSRYDSGAASQYSERAPAPEPTNPNMFSMDSMESKVGSAANNRYSSEDADVLGTEVTCVRCSLACAIVLI